MEPITFQHGHYSLCLAVLADQYVVSIFPVPGGAGCEPNCEEELFYRAFQDSKDAAKVYTALEQTIRFRHMGRLTGGKRNPLDMLSPSNAFMMTYRMALGLPLR